MGQFGRIIFVAALTLIGIYAARKWSYFHSPEPPPSNVMADGTVVVGPYTSSSCPSESVSVGTSLPEPCAHDAFNSVISPRRLGLHLDQADFERFAQHCNKCGGQNQNGWVRIGDDAVAWVCKGLQPGCVVAEIAASKFRAEPCADPVTASDGFAMISFNKEDEEACGRMFPRPALCDLVDGDLVQHMCLQGRSMAAGRKRRWSLLWGGVS